MSRSVRSERQAGNDEAIGFVVINSEARLPFPEFDANIIDAV